MQKDTRSRNEYFDHDTMANYLTQYADAVKRGLLSVAPEELEKAKNILQSTKLRGGRVFVAGNGGSAAIADHLNCDFVKGTSTAACPGLHVHSLVSSTSLFTAIANDIGFEHVFAWQVVEADISPKDCLILISSSGSSRNILKACKVALNAKSQVIGLTGFDGGALKASSTASLHVAVNNYGVIEDCHQAIMHALAQFLFLKV